MPIFYTFQTDLLSAQKTGHPNLIGTVLSAVGVSYLSEGNVQFASQTLEIVSLSTSDIGFAFTPLTVTVAPSSLATFSLTTYPTSTINILGTVVNIPTILNKNNMATIQANMSYTVFPFLSTTATVPVSALSASRDVSSAQARRKHLYGYN